MEGIDENERTEKISQLQLICEGISIERANQLLEAANGSVERSIDIFLYQQEQELRPRRSSSEQATQAVSPKVQSKSPENSPAPIVTSLSSSSHPSSPPSKGKKKIDPKQPRLESFFQTNKKRTSLQEENDHVEQPTASIIKIEESSDEETSCNPSHIGTGPIDKCSKNDSILVSSTRKEETISSPKRPPSLTSPFSIMKKPKSVHGKSVETTCTDAIQHEVSFLRLSEALQQMADTSKRLVKLEALKTLIRDITNHSGEAERAYILTCALRLVLGRRTSMDQAPLDISGSAVSKALQTMLGVSRMQLSKGYRQYGDLGDSAASLFQRKSFFIAKTVRPLSVVHVSETLEKIVETEGRDAKQHILLQLLGKCQHKSELRFLVRLLIGNMRVGANLKTVLAAMGMAITDDKEDTSKIKRAIELIQKTHDVCPNLEKIVTALLEGGLEQMQCNCGIQLLTPVAPMLAHPVHSLEQIQKAMTEKKSSAVMEWKYDGVRCQAHFDGRQIKLFSRHMLETTAQYPDASKSFLEAILKDGKTVDSFIMDSEIVGVEGSGDRLRLLPFQDLSRRKKKDDDGRAVRIKVFAFDIMYLNGISYIDRPLWERQQALRTYFHETADFAFVSSRYISQYDEALIRVFLEEAVNGGAEGLMLKMLGTNSLGQTVESEDIAESGGNGSCSVLAPMPSPYEAGTRSQSWLKVKRDYVAGYADSIDVVPIGAWCGGLFFTAFT